MDESALQLDGYRFVRPIDQGGQGRVVLAIRQRDQRKVAIKIIRPERWADAGAEARFEKERRILERLNHPHIVRILDHGRLNTGELWYATEYVDGGSVNKYVHDLDRTILGTGSKTERHEFPVKKVLELFVRICQGVEAAHQAGVLHRDLKPANILVDGTGTPRILDFGIARSLEPRGSEALTLTGQFIGSPVWCAPEQIEARPSRIDVRADVYSLGMMLYHALTGGFPFDVDQPWPQLFDTIRHAEPTPPGELRDFIDDDLQALVLKAIAKEQERRYATVAALREDLERYRRGEPILARGDGAAYRLMKFTRRYRAAVTALAIIVALTAAYAASVTMQYRRAEMNAADAREKFRAARDMLDFTLSQIDTELGRVAGASHIRRKLLEKAYAQLEDLTRERTDDPLLQGDLARLESKLADLAQGLGWLDKAAQHAELALAIREQLAATNAGDPDAQADLSIAIVRVGDIAGGRGDNAKRRAFYERALQIDESLVERYPDRRHYLDNLNWSYDRMSCCMLNEGDTSRAADYHLKRLATARQLLAARPDHRPSKYSLVQALLQVGADWQLGGPADGSPLEQRAVHAVTLSGELAAAEPTNPDFMRSHLAALRLYADLARSSERFGEATAWLQEAFAITERLITIEPDQPELRGLQLEVWLELGQCATGTGALDDARDCFEKALRQAADLAAAHPDMPAMQARCISAQCFLAEFYWRIGRRDEAREHWAEAMCHWKDSLGPPDGNVWARAHLARLLLACDAVELRDPALALDYARQAAEASQRRSPVILAALARAELANGHRDVARRTIEEGLSQLRPTPSERRRELETLLFQCDAAGATPLAGP